MLGIVSFLLYWQKYPFTSRSHLPSTSGFGLSPSSENRLGGGIFGCAAAGGGGRGAGGGRGGGG